MPATCGDGIRGEHETDVDCGGDDCGRCPIAWQCESGRDCFSGKCVAGTCRPLSVSFADAVAYSSRYKPYVLLSGDLDGDGDLDLAVGNELASTVSVFRNVGTSSGVFEPLAAPTDTGFPTGEYPTGGAIGDFDRDGIADVITADYHGNSVTILRGTGTGSAYTLTAGASYPTVAGAETSNLAVGDLDGDAILDVIATNPSASSVSVFVGRPDGTLAPATDVVLDAGLAAPYSVAIGDFDGDDVADAAVADIRSPRVLILLGNGDGTFRSGLPQPIGGDAPFTMIARDMNLDGILDLVVANRGSDNTSVLLGRGDGDFADPIVSSTGAGTGPYSLATADFNLDGIPDVVTANYKSSTASVLLGLGDGRLDAPIGAGATGQYTYGVAAGDFDGDGKPDFATANALSNDITVKTSTAQ